MANKYISLERLSSFLGNLRNTFASLNHKHTISDIENYDPNKAANQALSDANDYTDSALQWGEF